MRPRPIRAFGAAIAALCVLAIPSAALADTNASLWATLEQSSLYQRYAKANPNEASRIKAYWLTGGTKPVVATAFGKFLVEVNEDRVGTPPPPPPPPSGGYTANLYVSTTGGSSSCIRSATKVDYATAAAGGNVCDGFSVACTAATGGDEVGVRAGTYAEEVPAEAATNIVGDCSDGLGNDVDPTAQPPGTDPGTVISNWVTFECANAAADEVILDVKYFTPLGNNHMYVRGNCFYFGQLQFDQEGGNGISVANVIFDDVHMQAFQVNGSDNIWITNSELGPVVLCGQDGGPEPEAAECDASGSAIGFAEHRWANRSLGSSDLQTQGRVNPNGDGVHSTDVVIENLWFHDSQSKDSAKWHTGCMFLLDNFSAASDNVIWRNILCERVVHQGMYVSDASGLTIENSQVTCPTEPIDNTLNEAAYGVAACGQRSFHLNCFAGCSNLLVRYNSFVTAVDLIGNTDVGTNVRMVGNVAYSYTCPTDVATKDYNSYVVGAACGGNGVDLVAPPWLDTDYGTSPTTTSQVNMHLGAGPFGFENAVTPTTADYALAKDMDGAVRTSGARDAGADER